MLSFFTRRLNDVTPAVPDVVAAVRALPVRRVVLDGEVVALRADGRPVPFQVTMKRFGSRLDVHRLARELPLSPFFFDVVHLDGSDLLDRPGSEDQLGRTVAHVDGRSRGVRVVAGSVGDIHQLGRKGGHQV